MADYTKADVQQWPKIDLHCHLEGAIRPETILDLYRRNHNRFLDGTVEDIRPLAQIDGDETNFFDWLPIFDFVRTAIQTEDDLVRITVEAVEDAAAQNVRYLELRYSPFFITAVNDLVPEAVVEAVAEGRRQAAERVPGTHTELILIVEQSGGVPQAESILDLAQRHRADHRGVDIAGDMTKVPLRDYGPVFTRARDAGLAITVHAGEVAPAESVRAAVEGLHAQRIGHGIRSVEDPAVLRLLRERGTLLEVCVTSNLQTRVTESLEAHPVRALRDAGVRLNINTDDPGISGIDLTDEYLLLLNDLDFTREQFAAFNRDAVDAAFTDDDIKHALHAALAEGYA